MMKTDVLRPSSNSQVTEILAIKLLWLKTVYLPKNNETNKKAKPNLMFWHKSTNTKILIKQENKPTGSV